MVKYPGNTRTDMHMVQYMLQQPGPRPCKDVKCPAAPSSPCQSTSSCATRPSTRGPRASQPFRFAEQRRSGNVEVLDGGGGGGQEKDDDYVRRARNALPTTGPDFLVFGHGRHACPGRFFAAAELKPILARALLRCDFEILPERPVGSSPLDAFRGQYKNKASGMGPGH